MAHRQPYLPVSQAQLGPPVRLRRLGRRPAQHPGRIRGPAGHLVRQIPARELAQGRLARPGLVCAPLADPDRGGGVPDCGRGHRAYRPRPAVAVAPHLCAPRATQPGPPAVAAGLAGDLPGRLPVAAGGHRYPGRPGRTPRVRPGRQYRPALLHRPVGGPDSGRHRGRRGESAPAPAPLALAAGDPGARRLDHDQRSAGAGPDLRHQMGGALDDDHVSPPSTPDRSARYWPPSSASRSGSSR